MKLVVGLGNWGKEYERTRHNIGFDVLDSLSNNVTWVKSNDAHITNIKHNKEVVLIKPITGMNINGPVVKKTMDMYNIPVEDVIVVYDDMDFAPGQIKIKKGGGDGKHNGVKSLIQHIGSNFIRVRVGIGKPKNKEDGINFVLEPFTKPERKLIDKAIEKAYGAINVIINEGVESAMLFFNKKETK